MGSSGKLCPSQETRKPFLKRALISMKTTQFAGPAGPDQHADHVVQALAVREDRLVQSLARPLSSGFRPVGVPGHGYRKTRLCL